MAEQSSLKYNSYQDGNSLKMVMDEMCNRENTKPEGPNVIARLMGMDTLPKKTGSTIRSKECFDENLRQHAPNLLVCESTKADLCSLPSSAKNSPLNCKHQHSIPSKPHRRAHPQEEQLHIFKKEFVAWQESKAWELSSNLNSYSSEDLKKEQNFPLENLNKEDMAAYKNACATQKTSVEIDDYDSVNKLKITQNNLQGLQHDGNFGKQLMNKVEDDMAVRRELEENSLKSASSDKFHERRNPPSSSTRIVILKPSSDMIDELEKPWGCSPEVAKKCSSMDDFLEEVKEKLRLEIEGKGRNDSIRRFSLGHTSVHESSKQMAREAAKHGAILRRSQSMTNYRNQSHFDGHESSKSIRRETRKFISERLKIVLKDDTEMKKPVLDDGSGGKLLPVKEMERSKLFTAFSKGGKDATFWEDKKAVIESIPKHLRHEQMEIVPLEDELMSPSNFVRSFSAPALGKARLEDRGAETKARNSQKFEASKNDSAIVQKGKKDGFSIKNTVSNLRRNLGLRAKIFRKKASSMGESTVNTVHYVNQDEAIPSVIRNFGIVQDNSTEVPPSPASFPCSPVNDHHSPVSPLEGPFMDDNSSAQVSGELSMTLTEFENQTEHVEIKICGMENEETILTEGCGEAFVRDILLVSGFYRTSWPLDEAISSLDGQIKPISSCVFDEVEAKYKGLRQNVDDGCSTVSLGDVDIDRKMLFDLVNESLPSLIDAPMTRLLPKRSTRRLTQFPRGRKLIDDLLDQIHVHADPKVVQSHSIDEMVVWDLKMVPWSAASDEDICALCREVEWMIISDLVDDLLSDLLV